VADCAVIFDVDGVLLELTHEEEEVFFTALSKFVAVDKLSRDWNSYKIRNDEDIIAEIFERHNVPAERIEEAKTHYISLLTRSAIKAVAIPGAAALLNACSGKAQLGIATANFLEAAQHRLQQAEFWGPVSSLACGANGGGHKSAILGRLLSQLNMTRQRIVYVGDNLNDVEAGLLHGVHFIGFSQSSDRRAQLHKAGAKHISTNHMETTALISALLA
jgi:phosphoglycolate phosphatase-like HAD superfamily hydrolase